MPFHPAAKATIQIDGTSYTVAEHPTAPGLPYGQEGRAGTVYQLLSPAGTKALKVFKPRFSTPSLVMQANAIAPFSSLLGLKVCQLNVLSPSREGALLRQYPDLTYSLLMPWIEGMTWFDVVNSRKEFSAIESLELAQKLTSILVGLEEHGLAHCDLSSSNLILSKTDQEISLELIDIDGMFGPGFPKPEIVLSGSPGYAHTSIQNGSWNSQSDRFAGAVLIAEMLGWSSPDVRKAANDGCLFSAGDIQKDCPRYKLLVGYLQNTFGEAIADNFTAAWHSETLNDCPTFGKWLVSLPVIDKNNSIEIKIFRDITKNEINHESGSSKNVEINTINKEIKGPIITFNQATMNYKIVDISNSPISDSGGDCIEDKFIISNKNIRVKKISSQSPSLTNRSQINNPTSKIKSWISWLIIIVVFVLFIGTISYFLHITKKESNSYLDRTADSESTERAVNASNSYHDFLNSSQIIFGPINGSIYRDSNFEYTASFDSKLDVNNFIAEVDFINPSSEKESPWSYSIDFRQSYTSDTAYYLGLNANGDWNLTYDDFGQWETITQGHFIGIDNSVNGSNRITLVVYEQKATFFINDIYVTDLDVSQNLNHGNIWLVYNTEIPNENIKFTNFTVWKLQIKTDQITPTQTKTFTKIETPKVSDVQMTKTACDSRIICKPVEVLANTLWKSFDVTIQKGQHVRLTYISGCWSAMGYKLDGCNVPYLNGSGGMVISDASIYSVLWVIGSDSLPKAMISKQLEFIADQSGKLYLRMNDIDMNDNAGSIKLLIEVW